MPGHDYSFGVVKEAQARGDLETLDGKGRRVLRIDVGSDPPKGLAALRDVIERAPS